MFLIEGYCHSHGRYTSAYAVYATEDSPTCKHFKEVFSREEDVHVHFIGAW